MTDKKKQPSKSYLKAKAVPADKPKIDKLALEIGRRISEARNGLGFSQQAVHARSKMADTDGIGVSRAALSLYETGTNKPGAREITLLCEVLHVSPNWLLYGSESPAKTLQPTTIFLSGDDLAISTRLAFAMLALNPTDRDSLANLVFSMLSGKLGDLKLSSLMLMANMMRDSILKEMLQSVGEGAANLPLPQLIDKFIEHMSESIATNYGNLRPASTEEEMYEGTEQRPPRNLK
ncbi:MAG: helix-turn-helix domain-containing protein [Gallionella sp.]|nr:helix-turn-helix domain-containing protein [Gallionella sp.]